MHYDFVPLGITNQAVKVPNFLVLYLCTIPLPVSKEKMPAAALVQAQGPIKGRVSVFA